MGSRSKVKSPSEKRNYTRFNFTPRKRAEIHLNENKRIFLRKVMAQPKRSRGS